MRILVADVSRGAETIRIVMSDHAALQHVMTMEEGIAALEDPRDLILCGIHFDDSRMFDFLRLVKAGPRRGVPFVCFRDLESHLAPALLESLAISSRALGAACFVDLFDLKLRHGIEAADREFRNLLLSLVSRSAQPLPLM